MIRLCTQSDFDSIFQIINDAAQAYKGIIPPDRWHEPYMPQEELRQQIEAGVVFHGYQQDQQLIAVMGIQHVQDVTLIRHAYVRTASRNQGIGGKLLARLRELTDRPVLIGTWADAAWAVAFYRKHGFELVTPEEKDRLLRKYWSIPDRQVETSVVLADSRWIAHCRRLVMDMPPSLRIVAEKDQFARHCGLEIVELSPGHAKVKMPIRPEHLNGLGMVHGGAIFSLGDYAFALACNSTGHTAVAVNVSICYLKAARTGNLYADAIEVCGDGKMNPCAIRITDDAGQLIATFQGLSYRKTSPAEKAGQ
jgi:phenylacetic acid degradation protein PaaD